LTPYFTIVIPVFNKRWTLELLLACLNAQTFPREGFECVIVDDGSTDGTASCVYEDRLGTNVKLVTCPVNLGRSQARNIGLRESKGEIVVFLDGDMLPAPNLLEVYYERFRQTENDVVSGGRRHINLDFIRESLASQVAQLAQAESCDLFQNGVLEHFRYLDQHSRTGGYPDPIYERLELQLREVCETVPGSILCSYLFITSNVAVRRSALERVSGFDPTLRRYEDTDLGIRLWEVGARFACAPEAKAYHMYDGGQSDRFVSFEEKLGFFYRNPYTEVFLLNIWAYYNAPGSPRAPSPIFSNLVAIAQAGNERLSQPDVLEEFTRIYKRPLPFVCEHERDELINYYCLISGISRPEMEALIERMVASRVLAQYREGNLYFNLHCSSNWLRTRTTFKQFELLHNSYARINKTPFQNTGNRRELLSVFCQGQYEVSITPVPSAIPAEELAIYLPLPIYCVQQSEIVFFDFSPPSLAEGLTMHQGVVEVQLRFDSGSDLRIGYGFECRIHEFTWGKPPQLSALQAITPAYMKPVYPLIYLSKAKALLANIIRTAQETDLARARTIYEWIIENTYPCDNLLPDYSILDTRLGNCIQRTRLFIQLCRLARIPARERCGALLSSHPSNHNRAENRTLGYSPFVHTWSEFFSPHHGWISVEFHGSLYGKRARTELNINDPALRQEVERDTQLYDNYYFGSLDPFRIHTSDQANQVPTHPVVKSFVGWRAIPELLRTTLHRLSCTFNF
jgi:glycosyltransferase involved in cell wall biosynthesis